MVAPNFKRKLIGKGSFSKAYQVGPNRVEVISTCMAKECYALFSQDNPLAPVIERGEGFNQYFMPLYPKVKAPSRDLNVKAQFLYKYLRGIHASGVKGYQDFCAKLDDHPLIAEEDKENILDLAGDVCNGIDCRDMGFEISPRNISCTPEGDLVMLDCFFCVKALMKSRLK